jgi:hypothetical protein
MPPEAGVLALPWWLLPIVAPMLEVPLLPLPPPFMLLPVSESFVLALPMPPAGVLIAPPEPAESAILPALLAFASVCGALAGVVVLLSLPPQLLSDKPPSNKAARGKKELEYRIESKR